VDEELNRRLRNIEEKLDKVRTADIPALRVDIGALKIKATIWGAAGGVLGSLAAILIALVLALR
jgi:hypothetical protein